MPDPTSIPTAGETFRARPALNQGPLIGLTIGVVATFVCLGGILWTTWDAFRLHEQATENQLELQRLATQITRLDEVMSTSVRRAAVTNEIRWRSQHGEALTGLRAAISRAAQLAPGDSDLSVANREEVTGIEINAFGLVQSGQPERAVELVFGPRYEAARRGESANVAFLTHAIDDRLDRVVQRSNQRMSTTLLLALVASGFLLLLWFGLAGAIRRSLARSAVAERERRALEAALQDAQRLESLSVLAGGIAHDFNNLLTGILSNAGTARRKLSSNDPAQRHLSEIVQGSKLAAHLTAQLLAYAGKGQFQILARDLTAEVREIQDLLETSVRHRAHLTYDLAENLPPVQADPSQLQQALMNLVLNASESIEGEVDVIIRTRAIDLNEADHSQLIPGSPLKPGRCVSLEVEDSGWGMDRDTLDRVFIPFFSTKSGGRGLGLAATLGIVHRHGGGIYVESELGKGTLFRLLFPASEGVVAAPPPKLESDLSGHGVVLAVDDDEYILEAVYATLEHYGYSVLLANTGRRAIEIFESRADEIDMVLLDLSMPGMSGEETFRELRKIRADVKVLLSTGYALDEAAQRFSGSGPSGFLRKPYDIDELAQKVKLVLDRGGNERPGEALDQAMRGLRASYREKLPQQLTALDDALRNARSPDAAAGVDEARALAHRLAGTAGSYGFARIGQALEQVDAALRSLSTAARHDHTQLWNGIDASMQRARDALAHDAEDDEAPAAGSSSAT